ncbi:MAG: SDR family oxidoreductase [Candidatus Midichloria sp.]|nr:MAG: SDR family oxidoreductase [Candidatus Midichloria sp.]
MVVVMLKEILDKIIERVPMGRLAEVHKIARAALFLAAETAGFMTGVVLPINGGLRLY